ncbi:hypothetical protein VTP01DRAFT_6488 [Rhizomucor pusillus]|uniref:uncharacterized protein n=1 Tax=Rhizomucor pusillus TaxID=4840 RepID=UPI003744800D
MPTHRVKPTHPLFLPPSPPTGASADMSPPQEHTLQDMTYFLGSIETTHIPAEEGQQPQQSDAVVAIPEYDFSLILDEPSTPPPDNGLFPDLPSDR